jgi:tetratricopeptide (TPR) repeat protein
MIPTHVGALALVSFLVASLLAALAIATARRGDRRPVVAMGWIALTYFPASNLMVATGQLLADRTLYGATVGAALALAWTLDALPTVVRRAAMACAALLIASGVIVTARYAYTWTSHRSLWTRLIHAEPEEHLGYKLLGMDARARGDRERAVTLLAHARAMAPTDRQIRFEYGQALYEARRYDEAVAVFGGLLGDADVRDEPAFVGLYLDAVGRSRGAQAVVDASRPLQRTKSAATASLYAGLALERLGQMAAADSAYAAGLVARPGDTDLLLRRGAIAAGRGAVAPARP